MESNEIINYVLEQVDMKAPTFAKEIEVKYQRISDIQRGVTKNISKDLAEKITARFPQFNMGFLMSGLGKPMSDRSEVISSIITSELKKESKVKSIAENNLLGKLSINTVPLLPISAQAGTLNDFIVSIKNIDVERIISPIKSADYAITVTGDSMAPEFPNGSRILIKKINENSFIEWGKVYVLDTYNGIVIKILNEAIDKPGHLLCTSINQDQKRYAPFTVPKSDVIGVYKVMLCMSLK